MYNSKSVNGTGGTSVYNCAILRRNYNYTERRSLPADGNHFGPVLCLLINLKLMLDVLKQTQIRLRHVYTSSGWKVQMYTRATAGFYVFPLGRGGFKTLMAFKQDPSSEALCSKHHNHGVVGLRYQPGRGGWTFQLGRHFAWLTMTRSLSKCRAWCRLMSVCLYVYNSQSTNFITHSLWFSLVPSHG